LAPAAGGQPGGAASIFDTAPLTSLKQCGWSGATARPPDRRGQAPVESGSLNGLQQLGLRGLGALAVLWLVVVMIASRIGGTLRVMVGVIFIFPIVFSSIGAAWQASAMMSSAYQKQRHQQVAPAGDEEPEETEEEAATEPVIPEPDPSLDGPPIGQPLRL
jgi:hypothetical protein